MAVKIVTDSTGDIPPEIVERLGITVVPCNVFFGTEEFKDGVDLTAEEFYRRLTEEAVFPTTSQPSPGDFLAVYDELGADADGIVSVHLSAKLSGTCNSAIQAQAETSATCPIEVVDTSQASMGMGVVAVAAAETASRGGSHQEVVDAARNAVGRAQLVFLLDTLEYLVKGGRMGRARGLLGSVLKIKPMIILRDGVVDELGKARSFTKGMAKLTEVAAGFAPLESLCVLYTTTPEAAAGFAEELRRLLPEGTEPLVSRVGTTIGTYAGPGTLGIGFLQAKGAPGSGG
jgi:DegV family protein with EDD domain